MNYDVTVIGGGPAGLAAAIAANKENASVLLVEREARLGGILKQCIHDGFGLVTFGEKLTGPEYCERYIDELLQTDVSVKLLTFVTRIEKNADGFAIHFVNREGAAHVQTRAIVLATGCRERTAKQVFIHGTRPSGVFTAGTAQYYVNLMGELPVKRCVILGSGDIGLIMARRLTMEGAEVIGVYEAKPEPSGLPRNLYQCLDDFGIPLHLSHTVTRVFGDERLTAVEIAQVDKNMRPIANTEKIIECDGLILSVGLIPENELAESIDVAIDRRTKGPICDQKYMTMEKGVFCAGNALHVNDLVDYVTLSAVEAGRNSAYLTNKPRALVHVVAEEGILYTVPSVLDVNEPVSDVTLYFRASRELRNAMLTLRVDGRAVFQKKYSVLRPPEMERLKLNFAQYGITTDSEVSLSLKEVE
ncbi:MAG: pyridine nucleotide-disulfide oxidoreductase [Firmicutes bacterium HGW-Firmicutes-9]|jgi:thioredoxin reductase|nr:MAG: pyridine nucleotide-disulfide oxidoreductase [Firmicutes bacterium HGW-Firmicutes-9]